MQKLVKSSGDALSLSTEEIVATLLTEAGVAGKVPTDEHQILGFLGLKQLSFDFMNELDFPEATSPLPTSLRAALSLNEKLVAVQSGLGQKRVRFSTLHEIAHFVLPEHRDRLFLDTDDTLGWWTKARLEREANQMAADLLFQGHRFTEEALDLPIAIRSILTLAPKYGASYESAIRRFVERHVLPCAVIVYDKIAKTGEIDFEDDRFRIQYTITSEPFRRKFFSSVKSTEENIAATDLYKPSQWGEVVENELTVENDSDKPWRFHTEVFSNAYKLFQFVLREVHSDVVLA